MMGHQSDAQSKLFCYHTNLEDRIPCDHVFRKIRERINFDFIYEEVKGHYGTCGNVSKGNWLMEAESLPTLALSRLMHTTTLLSVERLLIGASILQPCKTSWS